MSSYYYAQNGQRHGPVPGARLKDLAAAGQLAQTDQICREGDTKWVMADQVKGLFAAEPEAVAVAEATAAEAPAPPRAAAGPRFHYRHSGQQAGPVTLTQLKEFAAGGRLLPPDFVWQEGTKNWVPAARIDGLFVGRRCMVNGVSFLHPLDWSVTVGNAGIRHIFWITVENDEFALSVSVLPANKTSPETWVQNTREGVQKDETKKDVSFASSESAIGGEKAQGFDFQCTVKSFPLSGRAHASRIGSQVVTMVWTALEKDFPRTLPAADLVRASLTIEESQERVTETERGFAAGVRGAVSSGIDAAMEAYRKGKK
jgi:hypothetical protein